MHSIKTERDQNCQYLHGAELLPHWHRRTTGTKGRQSSDSKSDTHKVDCGRNNDVAIKMYTTLIESERSSREGSRQRARSNQSSNNGVEPSHQSLEEEEDLVLLQACLECRVDYKVPQETESKLNRELNQKRIGNSPLQVERTAGTGIR
jgi:hypothetical protein